MLPGHPQGDAAGDEHGEERAHAEEGHDVRPGVDDLLEVVEHQEPRPRTEPFGDRLQRRATGVEGNPERASHRRQQLVGRLRRSQRDEGDATGEHFDHLLGSRDREPGLADAAWTEEREQPHLRIAEITHDPLELVRATDQRRRGVGEVDGGPTVGGWGGPRPGAEVGILVEYAALQLPQRGPGLDPELLDQDVPGPSVAPERVGLAARAVQGDHQLTPRALAQRVGRHERLDLGDQLVVAAERETGLDAVLHGGQALLDDLVQRTLRGERFEREVAQHVAPPEPDGGVECRHRVGGPPLIEQAPSLGRVPAEAVEVDRTLVHLEDVAGRAGLDQAAPDGLLERLPQVRHVDLQRAPDSLGRVLAPHPSDEAIGADHPVRVQGEHGEDRALLRAAQRHRSTLGVQHLEGAEQAQLHAGSVAGSPGSGGV